MSLDNIMTKTDLDDYTTEVKNYINDMATKLDKKIDSRTAKVYSMHINGSSESNPDAIIEYLDDAVGMTPARMNFTTGQFEANSWGDTFILKDVRPCIFHKSGYVMKYLDKINFELDEDGNTVTINAGLVDADVMIQFPEMYLRVIPDYNNIYGATVSISNVKIDGDFKDFPYIAKDGTHKKYFYMNAYNTCVINGEFRSLSGQQVSCKTTGAQEITYATAKGANWYTTDAGEYMLINFLLYLIAKTTNIRAAFGEGLHTGGNESINAGFRTGVHNDKGMFYGTNSGDATNYQNAVKIFGIENYYGFMWIRYAGDILDNGVRKVKYCFGSEDGSTTTDFNETGEGYVTLGLAAPIGTNGGYISKMAFTHHGMFAVEASGSATTYFCAGLWFNNSYHVIYALRGGVSVCGALVSAVCVSLSSAFSYSWWSAGAGISYK